MGDSLLVVVQVDNCEILLCVFIRVEHYPIVNTPMLRTEGLIWNREGGGMLGVGLELEVSV